MMNLVWIFCWLIFISFNGLIFWAFSAASFSESFSLIIGNPWGLVTLADLYIGFGIFSGFICFMEKNWLKSLLWILGLLTLGNGVALLYLLRPQIRGRISEALRSTKSA